MADTRMTYRMNIAGVERDLPLCPLNENLYIGAFVIFGDCELTDACATELLKKVPAFDCILTAESKGIPLAYAMSQQSGNCPWAVARKGKKVYMRDVISVDVKSITTLTVQHLCLDGDDAAKLRGKRVLIVDDVISTGESLRALDVLSEQAGLNIVGRVGILAEGKAADRKDIIFLEKLPLFDGNGQPID